jgi:hypothetical protein
MTASPTSSPVRGSVEDGDGSAAPADEDAVDAVAVAFDGAAADATLVVGGGAAAAGGVDGVVAGADGCVVVLGLGGLLEPDEPEPPSGSTYCWSPAEPPAIATPGTVNRSAAITARLPRIWRRRLTARVLHHRCHAPRGPCVRGHGVVCPGIMQIVRLQDLLQVQGRAACARRGVLGCCRPSSEWRPRATLPRLSRCLPPSAAAGFNVPWP